MNLYMTLVGEYNIVENTFIVRTNERRKTKTKKQEQQRSDEKNYTTKKMTFREMADHSK